MGKCAANHKNSLKEAINAKEVVAGAFSKYFNCLLVQGNRRDLLNAKARFFVLLQQQVGGRMSEAS